MTDLRSYCLSSSSLLSPADLQREFRFLTYSGACRALEELEALRLLGSLQVAGARRWGVFLPVDEERVRTLRRVFRKVTF